MNKHLQAFFAFSLFLGTITANAQQVPDSVNMIENGSFEELAGKLRRLGGIDAAKGWESPTDSKADLFSETVDSESPSFAPRGAKGVQSALSGLNYAGLRWYSYGDKEPRSYMQVKLKKMLKKGQKYCVAYYVSLGDLSKYSSDHLGAYLSRIAVHKKDELPLTYEPQVPNLMTTVYGDVNGWTGVCGTFTANGDEQYLIIGSFAPTEKITAGKMMRPRGETRPQLPEAYYFIDDVSVVPVKNLSDCSCEQVDKSESEFIYSRSATNEPGLSAAARVDRSAIYYKRYSKDLAPSMRPTLDTMVALLNNNKDLKVKLTGHIDATEVDRSKMRPDLNDLDTRRADAVKAYMVEAGIDAGRITTAGKKGEEPAADRDSEAAMAQNRRVEVDVVK
ncbi:MAG: OmpA family protein [Flavobacteriales bacterium]|jgi:outer membrane protein OmpA-like peptidoglycan-associated protein